MKRHVYLAMKSLEEAQEIFISRFGQDKKTLPEGISVEEALGRVTAEPVFARISAPSYHSAAMDGIVVRAEETFGISEKEPMSLQIDANALWINTGQAIPEGYNAVIMIEKVHQIDDHFIEIRSPAYPWQHIRKVGEDIVATQLLFPQNHRIRPYDLGALIASGVFTLQVWAKPKVAIIPTGSELIYFKNIRDPNQLPKNQIIEFNSVILSGLITECHGIPIVFDIVPDSENEIRTSIMEAVSSDADLIMINAGSSAGSKDYTANIIEEMGTVLVHGVAMMPGKPIILGVIKDKPVVGIPGYTVSATLSFEQFVKPILYSLQGQPVPKPKTIQVQPSRDIPSKLGTEEFIRVNIGEVDGRAIATPLPRAAGSITTLTRAEGIIRIPALSEGIAQTEVIDAELLVDEDEIRNTMVIIGSHDMTIDLLGDEIRRRGHNIRISSGNVGSLGGLIALRKKTSHMAGAHLLDTKTQEYNISYIKQYLKGLPVHVFHLVLRDQGLMVGKGNPKSIKDLNDLEREDITFVNRQAGSGTRILLDYRLNQKAIKPESINGYNNEEFTHMAVAVDVLSGAADCGMGIFAAAQALGLDFIPVVQEQYDLIIPSPLVNTPNIQTIMDIIQSKSFKTRVTQLGGYDPSHSGQLWMEVG
ncbi:MAG: molybdopterin biosynthesis protein [Deltaproteobacteria bacterium]|nr:molybdopterin biosynthesis protein [Deltaproteobacteria bacterium]